jgi:hypothetical protein
VCTFCRYFLAIEFNSSVSGATAMWLYPGSSCYDHPFFEELGDVEINTRIHKVLAHGAEMNLGADPTSLREGVDSQAKSIRIHFSVIHAISSSHHAHVLAQGLRYACCMPQGVTLLEDAIVGIFFTGKI